MYLLEDAGFFTNGFDNPLNATLAITQIKDLKIVPKNYYRNLWMVLGMSIFELPIGVALRLSIGNFGLGIPMGMAIGIATGTSLDKKAFENEKQLDIELK